MTDLPKLYNMDDICEWIGKLSKGQPVCRNTVYAHMNNGLLDYVKIGGQRVCTEADVLTFIERLRVSNWKEDSTTKAGTCAVSPNTPTGTDANITETRAKQIDTRLGYRI